MKGEKANGVNTVFRDYKYSILVHPFLPFKEVRLMINLILVFTQKKGE